MNTKIKQILGFESSAEKRERLLKEIVNVTEKNGKLVIRLMSLSNDLVYLPTEIFKDEDVCEIVRKIREANLYE